MATDEKIKRSTKGKEKSEKMPYEPPAVVYEGTISTRAGSPTSLTDDDKESGVDPADLFGGGS